MGLLFDYLIGSVIWTKEVFSAASPADMALPVVLGVVGPLGRYVPRARSRQWFKAGVHAGNPKAATLIASPWPTGRLEHVSGEPLGRVDIIAGRWRKRFSMMRMVRRNFVETM